MKREDLELLISYLKNIGQCDFYKLANHLKEKTKSLESNSTFFTNLYRELTLDNRFFLYPDKKWGLREYMTEDFVKKSNNSTYTSDDYFEDSNIQNIDNANTFSETTSLFYSNKKRGKNKLDLTSRISDDNLSKLNNAKNKHISQELGVTDEIDWNLIEDNWNENN